MLKTRPLAVLALIQIYLASIYLAGCVAVPRAMETNYVECDTFTVPVTMSSAGDEPDTALDESVFNFCTSEAGVLLLCAAGVFVIAAVDIFFVFVYAADNALHATELAIRCPSESIDWAAPARKKPSVPEGGETDTDNYYIY